MNFFHLGDEVEDKNSLKRGRITGCLSFERGIDPVPEKVFVNFQDGTFDNIKLKDLVLIISF